jgi:hypothetical protein
MAAAVRWPLAVGLGLALLAACGAALDIYTAQIGTVSRPLAGDDDQPFCATQEECDVLDFFECTSLDGPECPQLHKVLARSSAPRIAHCRHCRDPRSL